MAHKHRYMKEKIGPYQELPRGRLPGQKCVPREDRRAKDELLAAIGRAFGVSGTTAGKLIRKYQAEAGL